MEEARTPISQKEAKDLFFPALKERGQRWAKTTQVLARPAIADEVIVTVTKDGKETENRASGINDKVLRNIGSAANEEYILPFEKFFRLYDEIEGDVPKNLSERGYKLYQAKGKVLRIEFQSSDFNVTNPFYFVATWGEPMIVRDGDSIVAPPTADEVYRIQADAFASTYTLEA